MKAVILAGGLGTRISEETSRKPKPMIEIGGMPVLWHIMKIYNHYGVNEFIICCGYKGNVIKDYFANYFLYNSDVTFDFTSEDRCIIHKNRSESWKVTLVDTGQSTMTGGRLKRVKEFIENEEFFYFTYGDGVADINIKKLTQFHKNHGGLATLTGALPPGRFGAIDIKDDVVTNFKEKPDGDGAIVNVGFFVLNPKVLEYIDDDHTSWEEEPLKRLSNEGHLHAFKHKGFWYAMDTLRDKNHLDKLIKTNNAPWMLWK